jgi:hypothetical protein
MNAIIRHKTSGETFLATLDNSGDAIGVSAAIPITDVFGRDYAESTITAEQWEENFGYADVEPFAGDDEVIPSDWTAEKITVIHTI